MARTIVVGLAAHVDAGKTTLSESMLFLSGAVRRQGRVDHGDTWLDTDQMEKDRGITIFSKEARLTWNRTEITLIDTPGHADFSGEAERAVSVMDAAVLVISAPEGVQPHTRALWKVLRENRVPVIFFLNKTDQFQGEMETLLSSLRRELADGIVAFPDPDPEKIALCDERCLDAFLREGEIPDRMIFSLIAERRLFPCFAGAALKNEGVAPLLDFLARLELKKEYPAAFGARVYKVARDARGARLAFMKITGGVLKARDLLTMKDPEGETSWAEKAAEIRLYSGVRYTSVPEAAAGQVCCVLGLSKAAPGDSLGTDAGTPARLMRPCYACRLVFPQGTDLHYALDCLKALEEEEPLIQVEYIEARREIRVHSMGDVYLEVLRQQLKDRFGIYASFADSSVLYRETIEAPVEGVGHYEPLRHYAEVHLLLSPLPRGSGLVFDSAVHVDDLALNWQRLIMTHLREKTHIGVLTGSPVTDLRITLVNGKAHLKHTEGGDFRQATYRAVRQGLMKAQSVLLEPWMRLEITVPEEHIGRVMSDLTAMGGRFDAPEGAGAGLQRLTGAAPAGACGTYGREVSVYTKGKGSFSAELLDWEPCADPEKVIAEKGYDPLRDTWNTPDSVFCSHGAGHTVPWNEVEQYMHLPLLADVENRIRKESAASAAGGSAAVYRGTREEDRALQRIFEKTYGPVKARQLMPPSAETEKTAGAAATKAAPPAEEILLIDGYNVLNAWEDWKPFLEENNLEGARHALTDLMCNYAGATGKKVILVFDAYKVPGNPGTAEKYHNIFVIYTRESQTADAFIEQTTFIARGAAVRVVTSDRPEQLIASGNSAMRTSAREFRGEVNQVRGGIAAFLERNNRAKPDRSIEKAYKEAWVRKATTEDGKTR